MKLKKYYSLMVSIIITTYNRKTLLSKTINSILIQNYRDFEIIIVDNFSNYDFFNFIRDFNDTRLKPFQNFNNGIIAINRNFGIIKSKGEFVAFCDDDDTWTPTKLYLQISFIEKYNCDITSSNIFLINDYDKSLSHNSFISRIFLKILSYNILNPKYILILTSYINYSSVLLKKTVINDIGFINENKDLIGLEDFDFFYNILLKYKLHYTNKKLIHYRIHSSQTSFKNSSKEKKIKYQILLSYNYMYNKIQKILIFIFFKLNKRVINLN